MFGMLGPSRIEAIRLVGSLDRLTPHLRMNGIALTGGVGMQVGLAALGHVGVRDHVADLDLVATSLDVVSSSVVDQFLVSHYHEVRPAYQSSLREPTISSSPRVAAFALALWCLSIETSSSA